MRRAFDATAHGADATILLAAVSAVKLKDQASVTVILFNIPFPAHLKRSARCAMLATKCVCRASPGVCTWIGRCKIGGRGENLRSAGLKAGRADKAMKPCQKRNGYHPARGTVLAPLMLLGYARIWYRIVLNRKLIMRPARYQCLYRR